MLFRSMKNKIYLSITAILLSFPLLSHTAQAELSSQTMIGSALGGVVGTSIGHEMGGRDGAIIGAAVGAAAGAGIGQNMSRRHHYSRYERPADYGYRPGRDYRYRDADYHQSRRGYYTYRNGYANPHYGYHRGEREYDDRD